MSSASTSTSSSTSTSESASGNGSAKGSANASASASTSTSTSTLSISVTSSSSGASLPELDLPLCAPLSLSPAQLQQADAWPCPLSVARQHLQAARTFLPASEGWRSGALDADASSWARQSVLGSARYVTGSRYFGDIDVSLHSPSGLGAYRFTDGTSFIGKLSDGMFEGQGVLCFPSGAKLRGCWERGELISETALYIYNDGLEFSVTNWDYCQTTDRRYHRERMHGLDPAGRTKLVSRPELIQPEENKPPGSRRIHKGMSKHAQLPDELESVGFRPQLYEGWHWRQLYAAVPPERLRHHRVPYDEPPDAEQNRRRKRFRRHERAAVMAVADARRCCDNSQQSEPTPMVEQIDSCLSCAVDELMTDI